MPVGRDLVAREACPACNGTSLRSLYACPFDAQPIAGYFASSPARDAVAGGTFELDQCATCGLVFQKQVAGPETVAVLYDDQSMSPEETWRREEALYASPHALLGNSLELLRVLFYLNRPPSTITILDFGMGWAVHLRVAIGYGCACYGVEISKNKLEIAKGFGVTLVGVKEAIEQGLRFDFINVDQVLEHVAAPFSVLGSVVPLLKPDGVIKLSVPNTLRPRAQLRNPDWEQARTGRGRLNAFAPLEHVNSFSGPSLRAMAARAGLRRVSVPEVAMINLPGRSLLDRRKDPLRRLYARYYYWSPRNSTHLFFELNEARG